MKVIGVIPARLKSTRLNEKVITNLFGKPLIQWVYESVKKSRYLEDLIVVADDQKIIDAVKSFGGKAILSSKRYKSGTQRIAEVAHSLNADIIVNIQSDEPLINYLSIDNLISNFYNDDIEVATLIYPFQSKEELKDPNAVKVVIDKNNFVLYFSRAVIPYVFSGSFEKTKGIFYKHIGVYAYSKEFLFLFKQLPFSVLEKAEKLEQLRILENGHRVKAIIAQENSIGVDTKEDFKRVEEILRRKNAGEKKEEIVEDKR